MPLQNGFPFETTTCVIDEMVSKKTSDKILYIFLHHFFSGVIISDVRRFFRFFSISGTMDTKIDKTPSMFFAYPDPNGYAGIVAAVEGLVTPDKWRRETSCTYRAPYEGAPTYRLFVRECLFPGRCAICKKNNKTLAHCVIGQGAKNGHTSGAVGDDTVLKMVQLVHISRKVTKEDEDKGRLPAEEGVFVVPHETDVDNPKKLSRASQQHSFPPVEALLRQAPFTEYFKPETFAPFFGAPIVVPGKRKRSVLPGSGKEWTEPKEKFAARKRKYEAALAEPVDATRRAKTAIALAENYLALLAAHCTEACERESEARKKNINVKVACECCKVVRAALKKHYIDTLTKTVADTITRLFVQRRGPFAGCPPSFAGERYIDSRCRVQRVEEAPAAPPPASTAR